MKFLNITAATAILLTCSTLTFAKTINLYSEPKADSKIAGSVNTEAGVTIVYTPKEGDWIKVANPANGDVGWVKSSDLGGNGYRMRVMTSGTGPNSYSIYQFGNGTNPINQMQIDQEMKQFEQNQRIMQQHMQSMFNDMFNMFNYPQTMFVPVVIVPAEHKPHKVEPAKTAAQTDSKEKSSQTKSTPEKSS